MNRVARTIGLAGVYERFVNVSVYYSQDKLCVDLGIPDVFPNVC